MSSTSFGRQLDFLVTEQDIINQRTAVFVNNDKIFNGFEGGSTDQKIAADL